MSIGPSNPKPEGYFDGRERPPDPPAMKAQTAAGAKAIEDSCWWQVFCAVLNPAGRPFLKKQNGPPKDAYTSHEQAMTDAYLAADGAADLADAAIAEARRRGRL